MLKETRPGTHTHHTTHYPTHPLPILPITRTTPYPGYTWAEQSTVACVATVLCSMQRGLTLAGGPWGWVPGISFNSVEQPG